MDADVNDSASNSDSRQLAWLPDIAATFEPNSRILSHFKPVAPRGQADFLSSNEVGPQILCGGRGMGKSTLLLYRARHLKGLKGTEMVRSVPPYGYKLVAKSIPVSKQVLYQYSSSVYPWASLWKLIIGSLFAVAIHRSFGALPTTDEEAWIKLFGVTSDNPFWHKYVARLKQSALSPHDECVGDLAALILASQPSSIILDELYREKVKPLFSARSDATASRWVLYVDGIDEAIADWSGKRNLLERDVAESYTGAENVNEQNAHTLVSQVWINAQAGFALASLQLRDSTNLQLLTYGSIRSETFETFARESGQTGIKLETFVLRIQYEEGTMRDIFNYNVSLMNENELAQSSADEADLRFCGYSLNHNRTVFGHQEDVYGLIRRHCLGTPRGLVMTGRSVAEIPMSRSPEGKHWKDPRTVTTVVNKVARRVLDEHLKTLFPAWNSLYSDGFKFVPSNVLSKEQVADINNKFQALHPELEVSLIQYLHDIGLVGVPSMESGNEVVQSFPRDANATSDVRRAEYVMLHPALSAEIRDKIAAPSQADFYNRQFIVDPGKPCSADLVKPLLVVGQTRNHRGRPTLSWESDEGPVSLFTAAHEFANIFLLVLVIATRYFPERPRMGGTEMTYTAGQLKKIGVIPERLGKPLCAAEEWIHSIFDHEKHPSNSRQADAVAKAIEGLSRITKGAVSINDNYVGAVSYVLQSKALGERAQDIDPATISVFGFTSHEFFWGAR